MSVKLVVWLFDHFPGYLKGKKKAGSLIAVQSRWHHKYIMVIKPS